MGFHKDICVPTGSGKVMAPLAKRAGSFKDGLDIQGTARICDLFKTQPLSLFIIPADVAYFDPMGLTIGILENVGVTANNEAVIGLGYTVAGQGQTPTANLFLYTQCTGLVAADTIKTFWLNEKSVRLRPGNEVWLIRQTAPTAGTKQIVTVEVFGNARG